MGNVEASKKRYFAIIAAILVVAVAIIAAIFAFLPDNAAKNGAPERLPIRIGNIGEYSLLNLIADEKGYFAEEGLDAVLTEYDSGATSIAALYAGKEDVIVAADFVGVFNIFSHPETRIITSASRQTAFELVARKDHGISAPSDIKGKTIGVTRKTHGEFFLGTFLNFNNLRLTDVKIVDLPPASIVAELTAGRIDAAVTFGPYVFGLKQSLGNNAFSVSAQGNQGAAALLYSTAAFAGSNPETLERYIRALVRAEGFATARPDEVKRILSERMKYSSAYVEYLWPRISFHISLNQDLLLSMEDEARWIISNGLVAEKDVPNYLHSIYFGALDAVKPESNTIIH